MINSKYSLSYNNTKAVFYQDKIYIYLYQFTEKKLQPEEQNFDFTEEMK